MHAPVAIVAPSRDDKVRSTVYNTIGDLTSDYDESTEIYKNANAVVTADGYNAPVQVIEYSTGNGQSVSDVKSTDGAFNESTASIVDAVENNLDASAVFVIPTKDVPEKDVETLADALYNDRGGAVAYQVSDFDTMHKFSDHIAKSQEAGDGNVLGGFENRDAYPVAQTAAYLAVHIPCDLIKVGDLSDFQPTNLDAAQVKDVLASHFNVILNKADMYMQSTGKAVDGSYLDHFINTKYIKDQMTFTIQRFMNTHNTPYTQATIDMLKLASQSEANNLYKQGVFINHQPVVTSVSRADTPNSDVGSRIYRGIGVTGDLFNSDEKFNGDITLDE